LAKEAQMVAFQIHEAGFGGDDATIVLTIHNAAATASEGRFTLTGNLYIGAHLASEAGEYYGEIIRTVLLNTFKSDEFEFAEVAWRLSPEDDE
ncbi:MAG: hypothetical protein JJ992_12645, partial [Planctomycetes bacterium]|nr:hypothetical protein [Planctomycetota bacterium]